MRYAAALPLLFGFLVACKDEPPPPPPVPNPPPFTSANVPAKGGEVSITTTVAAARAALEKGRDDADNTREAEAIEHFREAIQQDPKLALGYAYLGYYEHGPAGDKSMAQALSLSKDLPEPERLLIEELAALRAGEGDKALALAQRITVLAPFDWHAQLDLGKCHFNALAYNDAEQAFGKAAAFGPTAAVVYNQLGYLYLTQRRFELAIVEFRKYAEMRPNEPNTLDSLGEALLAVGKLDEAEKSFARAAEMKFYFAWGGVAEARFLRGDWAGGMDALGKSRAGAVLPADQLEVDAMAVWALLAQRKPDDALARVEALEKEAQDRKVDDWYAAAPAYRALVLLDGGKNKEALEELGKAGPRLDKAAAEGRALVPVRRLTLMLRGLAEARLEKTAAEIEDLGKKAPAQSDFPSLLAYARGLTALSKGDRKEAAARFRECKPDELLCRCELLLMQELIGDHGDAATAAELRKVRLRDPMYVWVMSKIPPA